MLRAPRFQLPSVKKTPAQDRTTNSKNEHAAARSDAKRNASMVHEAAKPYPRSGRSAKPNIAAGTTSAAATMKKKAEVKNTMVLTVL